jgi:hypothetical protein
MKNERSVSVATAFAFAGAIEARPARAGLELGVRVEELGAAAAQR